MADSSDDQHETKKNYFTPAISSKYVHTIFNLPSHNEWLSSLIYDALELQPGHILVDMGCGPGLESINIINKMKNTIRLIGNEWAIKNVTFCILTISHSFFILMN